MVALGLILVLLLSSGSGSGSEASGASGVPAAPAGPTAAERIHTLEKTAFYASQKRDLAGLKQAYDEAKSLSAAGVALKTARYALDLDGSLAWAHEGVGDVKFDGSGLPEDVEFETPDWKTIQAALKDKWIAPDRAEELAQAKTRLLEHVRRLKEDAHYLKVCRIKANIRLHPIFKDYDYTTIEVRPYLIFVQKSSDPRKAEKLQQRAEEKGRLFRCLYETFRKEFGERFQLTPLESDDFEKDTILKAWVFADRESFKRYHDSIGQPMDDSIGAYYNPQDQWMNIPEDAAMGMNPPGQDMDVNVCFHEGTHQLIHHWTKRIIEEETGQPVEWTDSRLDTRSHWFQEGIAEYFGSAVKDGDSWKLFQPDLYRILSWREVRKAKAKEWVFEDMLKAENNGDLARPGMPQHMGWLFYGQAWAFISFLNTFENGKYRDKFLAYMEKELHGRSGYTVFKEVFGLEEVAGSQLEKDYMKFCEGIVGEGPGSGGSGGGGGG